MVFGHFQRDCWQLQQRLGNEVTKTGEPRVCTCLLVSHKRSREGLSPVWGWLEQSAPVFVNGSISLIGAMKIEDCEGREPGSPP